MTSESMEVLELVLQAFAAERAACAKIALDYSIAARAVYKGRAPETDAFRRGDPHTDGQSDAADAIAQLIMERR